MIRSRALVKPPAQLFPAAPPHQEHIFLPVPTTLPFFLMRKRKKPVFSSYSHPSWCLFPLPFPPLPRLTPLRGEIKGKVVSKQLKECVVLWVRSAIWVGRRKKEGEFSDTTRIEQWPLYWMQPSWPFCPRSGYLFFYILSYFAYKPSEVRGVASFTLWQDPSIIMANICQLLTIYQARR